MPDLIHKAVTATRESKHIEFKQGFDPSSAGEWCEVVKDIVAVANSGGGVILFGLDSCGQPSGASVEAIERVDPADLANKIAKYTGPVDLEFEIRRLEKNGQPLVAIVVQAVAIPIVFQKPGTYEVEPGRQRTAFGVGTIYFRHGAKSEPGTSLDLQNALERQIERVRKAWMSGVRKVVHAPPGSRVFTAAAARSASSADLALGTTTVRAVNDPHAISVVLVRNSTKATGHFYHEGISEGIFEEINNVIEANRVLARGQPRFFLGQPVYYRVYAERQHVTRGDQNFQMLLNSSIFDFYSPCIFWLLHLADSLVVHALLKVYLQSKGHQVHFLLRLSVLFGLPFSSWLLSKWHMKWGAHPQPPQFYWTLKDTVAKLQRSEPLVLAARTTMTAELEVPGAPAARVKDLLERPEKAAALLSKACLFVFQGHSEVRNVARNLDFLAYGQEVRKRAAALSEALITAIGDRAPGDQETSSDDVEAPL